MHQCECNYFWSRCKLGNAVKNTKLLFEVDIRFWIVRTELRKLLRLEGMIKFTMFWFRRSKRRKDRNNTFWFLELSRFGMGFERNIYFGMMKIERVEGGHTTDMEGNEYPSTLNRKISKKIVWGFVSPPPLATILREDVISRIEMVQFYPEFLIFNTTQKVKKHLN